MWDASIRIANQTEIPLVWVVSHVGPLYWGVLQPGQRVTQETGRCWFTVTCYPYDGHNQPTTDDAILGVLIPTAAAIFVVATAGVAAAGAVPVAGTTAAALQPLVSWQFGPAAVGMAAAIKATGGAYAGATLAQKAFMGAMGRATNKVEKVGHYANGDWMHVRGGIKKNEPYSSWQPMRFDS
jgi:hypothetical protein